jgi:hypothetical protein
MELPIKGGCYCGNMRYEISGHPQSALQCHCRECQYFTGGHPNIFWVFDLSDFTYVNGTVAQFTRSDIDAPVTRHFCPSCGTAIGTRTPSRPNAMIVKVGTFDDPSHFEPAAAIFTCDIQPYHYVPKHIQVFKNRP